MSRRTSLSAAAFLLCGGTAHAQEANQVPETTTPAFAEIAAPGATLASVRSRLTQADLRRPELARLVIGQSVANGPTDRALGVSNVPDIQLLASADEKVASLALSFQLGSPSGENLAFTQGTLKVATAVDSGGDTELFGLRGFPGGTEVTFTFTHFFGGMPSSTDPTVADALMAAADNLCRSEIAAAAEARREGCRGQRQSISSRRAAELFGQAELDSFVEEQTPRFPFIGLSFGGNQDSFRYLDRAAFALSSESHFGYNLSAFAGIILPHAGTSITATYTYSRRYEAQSAVTLCQTINPTQEQCLTGPDGPPGTNRRSILSLEWRQAIDVLANGRARFAIAPEFSADLRNHAYSIDVPIYLAQDTEGKLRGGVRLGYVNRRETGGGREGEFSIGVFVGAPFNILN